MTGTRRFFQIHLSTAVVLMVLAGILIGLNVRYEPTQWYSNHWTEGYPVRQVCGWPAAWKFEEQVPALGGSTTIVSWWAGANIVINVVVSLVLLAFVWLVCECRFWLRAEERVNAG